LQTMWKVILPQALIVALRPYGNEIILMIKGSAIVAIITVYDLMGITKLTYSRTFDFQSYVWAAIIYLIIVEILRHAVEWIERRITIHLHR
jgi:polar amino acid transport system permease protein